MSRSPTVTRAWNVVVDFLVVFFKARLYAPLAFVRLFQRVAFPSIRRFTCAPATAVPPCVTFPEILMIRLALLMIFLLIDTAPSATTARVSTVPATFGTPVFGAYGVVIVFQTLGPAGTVKMLST